MSLQDNLGQKNARIEESASIKQRRKEPEGRENDVTSVGHIRYHCYSVQGNMLRSVSLESNLGQKNARIGKSACIKREKTVLGKVSAQLPNTPHLQGSQSNSGRSGDCIGTSITSHLSSLASFYKAYVARWESFLIFTNTGSILRHITNIGPI